MSIWRAGDINKTSGGIIRSKLGIFDRPLYQAALGWILAIAVPTLLYAVIAGIPVNVPTQYNTIVGSTLSLIVGVSAFRKLHIFPGLAAGGYVVMCISTTFGILTAALIILRLDYSRVLLLLIYLLTMSYFTITHLMLDRKRKYVMGVIPGGLADHLPNLREVEWCVLGDTGQHALHLDGVVADLRHNHDSAGENRITAFVLQGTPVYDIKQK